MKATILAAQRPTIKEAEKVAIISFDNWSEYHRLGDVANTLSIELLEVRAYLSPRHLEDIVNALEAVGADVDIRQPE